MGLLKVFFEKGRTFNYSMLKSVRKSQPGIPLYEQVVIGSHMKELTSFLIAEFCVSAL
jgi:hypothetical protein